MDGIFHLCRAFDDAEIVHVEGDVDPVRDLQIIHEELRLKDEEMIVKLVKGMERDIARIGKGGNAADKAKKEEFEIYCKLKDWIVDQKKDVRDGEWNGKEIEIINPLQLLTAKPVVYLCNLSERDYCRKKNKWLPKIKAWIDEHHPGDLLIPYSGIFENQLSALQSPEEKEAHLKKLTETHEPPMPIQTTLPKIIVTGYSSLQLIYCKLKYLILVFTGGPDEVRAWTIRKNTKAPQAAGTIHTDFEKAFVMAEVMKYDDLKELGTEAAVKAAGKYTQKGKEYVVNDGDICYFKIGQIQKKK